MYLSRKAIMETLLNTALIINVILCAAFLVQLVRYSRLVRGTYERYISTTKLIILCSLITVITLFISALDLAMQYYFGAAINVFSVVLWIKNIQRLIKDDNWFNDTHKKLKRKLSSFREKLSQLRVQPAFN